MTTYLRPDVYVKTSLSGEKPIQANSSSVACLVGYAESGPVDKAVLINSWSEYVETFAYGLDSPYVQGYELAFAVYGFFQNGGSKLYVKRLEPHDEDKGIGGATAHDTSDFGFFQAKYPGAYGNFITVKTEPSSVSDCVNVYVMYKDRVVESYRNVPFHANMEDEEYWSKLTYDQLISHFPFVLGAKSKMVVMPMFDFGSGESSPVPMLLQASLEPESRSNLEKTTVYTFEDGTEAEPSSSSYEQSLECVMALKDAKLVGFVESYSDIEEQLLEACTQNDKFAIVELRAEGGNIETVDNLHGASYGPRIKVLDPLKSVRGNKGYRFVSPVGHMMGVYARTDANRGVHKAPAGLEAVVKGALGLQYEYSDSDIEDIVENHNGNVLKVKPNTGVVVWGARALNTNYEKRYVTDIRYELMLKESLKEGLEFAMFEPNDSKLWQRVNTAVTTFLDSEWRKGALKGSTSSEAYYVKCDEELNTEDSIKNGFLNIEVGYAKQKPAEFVVINLVQKTQE